MQDMTSTSFPWYKFYDEGVPHEINPDVFPSLVELIEDGFKRNASLLSYGNMGKNITFAELDILSQQFAAYLQKIGLKKGDRIAIQMPNVLQYPIATFGAIRAGLTVVNTNPLYTPREMLHQFKDSGATAIVIVANFASNLEKIIDQTSIKHVIITELGDMLGFPKSLVVNSVVKYVKKMVPSFSLPEAVNFKKALKIGENATYLRPQMKSSDVAFIQYTGGTTGVAKGASLTHRNLIANIEANAAWLKPVTDKMGERNPVMVAALPLYHVYALTVNALMAVKSGGFNLLLTNPRDLDSVIKDLKKHRINIFPGLNTLFNGLMNHPKFNELDFSGLKVTTAGGMALQQVVAERWTKMTGCMPAEGYGLSETSPVVSSNPLLANNRIGTIGLPWPSTELRILKDDDTWAEIGERGEICVQGPQVMKGYYNRPEETKNAFFESSDGRWFRTGDIGVQDEDGYFKIVDRKKDMILVSGFNVYPNEIEDVVSKMEGIKELACVGIPNEKSTEIVQLFVVKKDPNLTEKEIMDYCRANLTAYKCPKKIEFRDELPKTNVGKILRKALREEFTNKKE